MLIVVTGAAGRLGSRVVAELTAAGRDVRAADWREPAVRPAAADWRTVDLTDTAACAELLQGATHVAHLATHPDGNLPAAHAVNLAMHRNLLEPAEGSGVRHLVFASSIQAVIGEDRDGRIPGASPRTVSLLPLDGDAPASPGNLYGEGKAFGERLLARMGRERGLRGTILRFPALYADVIRIRQGAFRVKPAHIAHAFTWLSFADAARLVATALQADAPGCRTYLPAAPGPRCGRPVGTLIQSYYSTVPWRPGAPRTSLVDLGALQRDLGWTPRDLILPRVRPRSWWRRLLFLPAQV